MRSRGGLCTFEVRGESWIRQVVSRFRKEGRKTDPLCGSGRELPLQAGWGLLSVIPWPPRSPGLPRRVNVRTVSVGKHKEGS